jgi:bisphosphoglycerate-dependent phosphoglycerate mutase
MQNQTEKKMTNHQLTINGKQEVLMTGVDSVIAFAQNRIALTLTDGAKVFVAGIGLKITAFSKTDGTFRAVGLVTGVSYGSKSFTAKIFK